MLDHPEAPWTVTGLAKRACMSRGSFAATFKESLGESPHAYLSRLRMGLAAQLLRNPSTLIATVADKVGFGSDVAFYRAFRRHFGQSPRSEEHTSELQSLMRISYAVFCLKKKTQQQSRLMQ